MIQAGREKRKEKKKRKDVQRVQFRV